MLRWLKGFCGNNLGIIKNSLAAVAGKGMAEIPHQLLGKEYVGTASRHKFIYPSAPLIACFSPSKVQKYI